MTPVDILSFENTDQDDESSIRSRYSERMRLLVHEFHAQQKTRALAAFNAVNGRFDADGSFESYQQTVSLNLDGNSLPFLLELVCIDHAKNLSTARGLQGAIALHAASKKDNLMVKVHWDDWQLNRSMFDSNLHFAKIMISRKVTKASAKTIQNWCTEWEKMKK